MRLYYCKAVRGQPAITILKDFSMWLHMDETVHGPALSVPSGCELFGFHTGDFKQGKASVLLAGLANNVFFCVVASSNSC